MRARKAVELPIPVTAGALAVLVPRRASAVSSRRLARSRRRRAAPVWLAAAALVVGGAGAARAAEGPSPAAVHGWVAGHQQAIVDELRELLTLPNVAADQPDIRRNAALLRNLMERRGIATRLLDTGGSPAVYGTLTVPGASTTLLVYAHYDGQPVDASQWTGSGPFTPVLRAGSLASSPAIVPWGAVQAPFDPDARIYARSASDDKGAIVAMLAALDALAATNERPATNLTFLFEGEEEAGSPHLEKALRANAALLDADVAVVADGPVYPNNAPTVSFGARGIVTAELTVYGAVRPLHSGHYGNWAPNPAERLAGLLASMQDADGHVTIAGWYDDVVPPGAAEQRALAVLEALPENERERRALGVAAPEGGGASRWARVMEPSLNIDGMASGWVGGEARTIIPDRAVADLDLRLVPDVEPQAQIGRLVAHLEHRGWHVVHAEPDLATRLRYPRLVRVDSTRGYPAVRTPLDQPVARAVIAALSTVAGKDLVIIPTMGGSVPGYLFPRVLGAPFVGLPIANPDNNQHSPNENLRLGNLFRGVELFAALFETRLPAAPPHR